MFCYWFCNIISLIFLSHTHSHAIRRAGAKTLLKQPCAVVSALQHFTGAAGLLLQFLQEDFKPFKMISFRAGPGEACTVSLAQRSNVKQPPVCPAYEGWPAPPADRQRVSFYTGGCSSIHSHKLPRLYIVLQVSVPPLLSQYRVWQTVLYQRCWREGETLLILQAELCL